MKSVEERIKSYSDKDLAAMGVKAKTQLAKAFSEYASLGYAEALGRKGDLLISLGGRMALEADRRRLMEVVAK